jgi:hypothetical protein
MHRVPLLGFASQAEAFVVGGVEGLGGRAGSS